MCLRNFWGVDSKVTRRRDFGRSTLTIDAFPKVKSFFDDKGYDIGRLPVVLTDFEIEGYKKAAYESSETICRPLLL